MFDQRNIMTPKKLLLCICLVIFSSVSSYSWAQINAALVWEEFKQITSQNGFKISALVNRTEKGMKVSEFTLNKITTETGGAEKFEIDLMDIDFLERSDGSVEILPDYDQEIVIRVYEGSEFASFILELLNDKATMIISGDVGAPVLQINSSLIGVQLKEFILPEKYHGDNLFDAGLIFHGLVSNQAFSGAKQENSKSSFKADSIDLFFDLDIPTEQMSGLISYELDDILVISRQDNLQSATSVDLATSLKRGYNALGSYTIGKGLLEFNLSSSEGNLKGKVASENSEVSSSLTQDGLLFDAYFTNGIFKLSSSALPIPIDLSVANANYGFTLPLLNKNEPQGFGVRLGVLDLLISRDLWGMLDPSKKLPNQPINASISLSGKSILFENFTDFRSEIYAENNGSQFPVEVEKISLEKLNLSLMGASLQGKGDLLLDNDDLITFNGYPKPVGSFEFLLSGANALVDKLIDSGIVDPDTAMGARMMFSMFAVPTGDDKLRSKIEFNSLGHILANGQRLR
jgi:hypothetical protein